MLTLGRRGSLRQNLAAVFHVKHHPDAALARDLT